MIWTGDMITTACISLRRIAQLLCGLFVLTLVLAGCEAPLNLAAVESEQERDFRRYDMLQAVARSGGRLAVVSAQGAVLTSADQGGSWQRIELPGRPSLIDITACSDGSFYALDSMRRVWREVGGGAQWLPATIDTQEATLSIHCAPNDRVWVSASFGTLYWADQDLGEWHEYSLYEDLQFTAVQFVDRQQGFALGEFGTVIVTHDGGDSWESLESIPNEFYPMAVAFRDSQSGWAGGLDGVIWETKDGGSSWQRQETVTTAPIYGIHADHHGVFAVGGSAKLVELEDGQWRVFDGAPEVLAYMRGIATLEDGSLVVAGGGGTVAVISLRDRKS